MNHNDEQCGDEYCSICYSATEYPAPAYRHVHDFIWATRRLELEKLLDITIDKDPPRFL